jgi:hypothetical protein
MNLEIDKRMNSAHVEFGLMLGTAGPAQRTKWPNRPMARAHSAAWSPRRGHARSGALTEDAAVAGAGVRLRMRHHGDQGTVSSNVRWGGAHQGRSSTWRRWSRGRQ